MVNIAVVRVIRYYSLYHINVYNNYCFHLCNRNSFYVFKTRAQSATTGCCFVHTVDVLSLSLITSRVKVFVIERRHGLLVVLLFVHNHKTIIVLVSRQNEPIWNVLKSQECFDNIFEVYFIET